LIVLLGFGAEVPGQSVPGTAAPVHEDVVVTADRAGEPRDDAPAAVSTLSREEIEALPAASLGELVRYLPGFQLFFGSDAGGTPPMLTARGFFGGGDAEYVQVRVDGVPVGDANSGIVDWRALSARDIDRIEAVRGAASPLYGDTALAGVIQVFTRTASTEGSGGSASVSGGSFGTARAEAQGGASAGDVRFDAAGSGSRTDGYREHAAEKNGDFLVRARRGSEAGTWAFQVSGSGKDRDDPGQLPLSAFESDPRRSDALFRFDHESTQRLRAALSLDGAEGSVPYRATLFGALRSTDLVRTLLLAPGLADRAAQGLRSEGGGAVVDARWQSPDQKFRLRGGGEWSRDAVRSDYRSVADDGSEGTRIGEARGRRDRAGLFAAADWDPSSRVRLTSGIRWDRIDDRLDAPRFSGSHEAWSPQFGAVLFLGPREAAPPSLFVDYSRAFKAATFDQQFDPRPFSDFQGGTFSVSNPELSPQRARMIEGGARFPWRSGRIEATAYRIDVDDEIDFDPAIFRYRNIGRSRHVGLETLLSWSWSRSLSSFVSDDWTRVESREGEDRGRQLKNIPKHVVRAGLAAHLSETTAEAIWTWTGGRYLDDANRFRFADVSVVDLRLSRELGDFRVRVDALNLAGARYADVGFTLSDFQGNTVPYVYPAAGRAVRVGIDWRP